MFDKDDCFRIGHIARIHGYKGELSIFLDVDHPDEFENMESVFVEYDKKLIPFFFGINTLHHHLSTKAYATIFKNETV